IEIAKNWALAKVQETERASSVLLKDDLFQAFHAENPEIFPNERKSCLGVADVLEYDESSEKGFIELKTKIQVTVNKLVPKHGDSRHCCPLTRQWS
ncbi:unnamed protein product, partial [Porites lobata]